MKLTLVGILFGMSCALAQTPGAQTPSAPAPSAQVQAPPAVDLDPYKVNDKGSVGVFYWMTSGRVDLNGGLKAVNPDAQSLRLPNATNDTRGVTISTPAGKYNSLQIEVYQAQGSGLAYATRSLSLFGTNFTKDDPLATSFRVRGGKISWNYLTFPSPPEKAKLRIKTLWEVHVLQIQGVADDIITTTPTVAIGTKMLIMPTIGMGFEFAPSKHFHLEVQGSGMALPGKSRVIDVQAAAVIRIKKLEAVIGAKAIDFRTSPQSDQYFRGRLQGPYGGLRWVF